MSLMFHQLRSAVVPNVQSRPVHELTIGGGSTVGDAVGSGVEDAPEGAVVVGPEELGEQLDRRTAPAAIIASGVPRLSRINLSSH
jgi:hypothetical protein